MIPAAAFDTWTNSYYISQNPGDFFPWNQAIATSGHTISSSLIFTAPSDGKFVVVALNEHPTNPTVTVGAKAYRTGS